MGLRTMDSPSQIFRFGPYELETGARQLSKNGTKLKLRGQPYLILEALLHRAGEVVSRDEIRQTIWASDTFVDFEHGLNTSVKKLRQILCDSATAPRYIETLPRLGYRFIAPVEIEEVERKSQGGVDMAQIPALPPSAEIFREGDLAEVLPEARSRIWGTRVGFAVLLLIVAVLSVGFGGHFRWSALLGSSTPTADASGSPVLHPIHSIAVLPLQNLSNDPSQDYFADGMSDELITDLAQLGGLKVISRTSTIQYKGTKKIVPQIGRELGVDALIEGTVERAGNRVRIRVQLIECATDRHLWAQSYDRELSDILGLQGAAARDIAEEIQGRVIAPQLAAKVANVRPVQGGAYDAYLKGRYFWNKRSPEGLQKSITYYQEAISEDPQFAAPYAGLADVYSILGSDVLPASEAKERAQAAADKALELDPSLAEGHATLGLLEFYYDWNWSKAEQEFRQAIQLNPNYATGHQWYSSYLTAMGRFQEAVDEANVAKQLDPLSLAISSTLSSKYYYAGQYDRAIALNLRSLEMDPTFLPAHIALASEYQAVGRWQEAFQEANNAVQLSHDSTTALVELGKLYGLAGKQAEAQTIVQKLITRSAKQFVSPFEIAEIYATLGDRDSTMRWLEKSYSQRESRLPFLKVDSRFDQVRPDPRFQDLLHRIGLVQ
jgi:TolB-like protein/DNA-binding winged helix-turn-helix (wHTH) protein/Tfp pilus assembly protein PilF